jgi:hypothetical protein
VITTWRDFRGIVDSATCLWQDLDGVHVAPAPEEPPPTSILWAWSDQRGADGVPEQLWRARIEGDTVFVAQPRVDDDGQSDVVRRQLVTWGDLAQVRGMVRANDTSVDIRKANFVEVTEPIGPNGEAPVSFLYQE